MSARRAAVVGAGLSGLTAAYRLKTAGWEVTVLEAAGVVGGRVRTETIDGYMLDTGATAVAESYDAYLSLAEELGIRHDIVPASPHIGIWRDDQIHLLRLDQIIRSGLRTGLLSPQAKLRAIRIAVDVARAKRKGQLDYSDMRKAAPLDIESAQQYATRALGSELSEYLCEPVVRMMLITDTDTVSVVELFSGLANIFTSRICSLRGGQGRLPQILADYVGVTVNAPVDQVSDHGDHIDVSWHHDGAEHRDRFDACVISCPLPIAAAICPDRSSVLQPLNAKLGYTKCISVAIATRIPPPSPAMAIEMPACEDDTVALMFLDHNKNPDRVPTGHGLISCCWENHASQTAFDAPDEEITARTLRTVLRVFPQLHGQIEFSHITRWEAALPHTQIGAYTQIGELNAHIDPGSRIQFAADYMSAAGQNTAVAFGTHAAHALTRAFPQHSASSEARGSAVVVGAGISGLAAAWRLERAGVDVTVLEPREHAGGRVRTELVRGYLVDTGPDAATAGYEHWLTLIDELGLSHRVAPTSAVIGTVRHGTIIDIDPARPLKAAMTPALSLAAKARMAVGLVRLRGPMGHVDAYELNRSAELDDPDSNAYEFARRYFGREVADYLIDGAMRLVSGSGAQQASTLGVLGALTGWSTPTVNITGGLQSVPDAVAERLRDLRLGTTATQVASTDEGVTVAYTDANGSEHELRADSCIIATMYDAARDIWPALDAHAPDFAANLRDVKLISISLGYTRRPHNECYIVSVPTADEPDVLLMFMQHNKAPDRAPHGHALITVYTDTLATDRYLSKTDAELEEWAADIVERLCPELAGHRDMGHVTRWPKAGYLATPGFWRRSHALLHAIPPTGRVQLAGDLFGAGSMESSVRWGNRAADRLLLSDCHQPDALGPVVTGADRRA